MPIVYRTAGPWGPGLGQNLPAAAVDGNFRDLDQRMKDLEDHPPDAVSIANITATGAAMTVHLTNGTAIGPLRLPVAGFQVLGDWQPGTPYVLHDILRHDNTVFIVKADHTSAASFDPARVMAGEAVYQPMTRGFGFRGPWQPETAFRALDLLRDAEGSVYIVRHDHVSGPVFDPAATTADGDPLLDLVFAQQVLPPQPVTIGAAVSGRPSGGQVILIPVTRALTLPAGAAGSQASAGVAAAEETGIAITRNGTGIGTVRFAAAGMTGSFVGVAETAFGPGDRLGLAFPASADAGLANIGIALAFTAA